MPTPSSQEQELLELTNRMRLNPQQELNLLVQINSGSLHSDDPAIQVCLDYFKVNGAALAQQWATLTAAQPLAWSEQLAEAADGHNALMVSTDTQSHQLPGELSLSGRANAVGWRPTSGSWQLAENVYAYAKSVSQGHAGFAIDWGSTATGIQTPAGHRNNIMNDLYREVGISVLEENNPSTGVGQYLITQDFGYRSIASSPYTLGVAFHDLNGDGWYQAGEGRAGINVTINGVATQTWNSGGYQLQHVTTAVQVTFSGGDLAAPISVTLAADSDNVKLDLIDDDLRSSGSVTLGMGAHDLTLIGVGDIDAIGNDADNSLVGTGGTNRIEGRGGNDWIDAAAGNDRIDGDDGADRLFGGGGDDSIDSGAGDDSIFGGDDGDAIDAGTGDDVVYGGDGLDRIFADAGHDVSYGGGGTDIVLSEDGDDTQFGGEGGDFINGGLGNDLVVGMEANDWLEGEAGDDVILAGDGNDMARAGDGSDRVYGGAGDDGLMGQAGDDIGYGDDGNDWVQGGGDDDTLFGGYGLDLLSGDGGDDRIDAGDGDDLMSGGGGADILRGGAGDDVFVEQNDGSTDIYLLTAGDNGHDKMLVFEDGVDTIRFSGFGFQGFEQFLQNGGFIDDPNGGTSRVVSVGLANPGQGIDVQILVHLSDQQALTAADFEFV